MFGLIKDIFSNNDAELVSIVKNGAYLVDVRTPGEFAEGYVAGSVNIPLDQIGNRIEEFNGKAQIVVFCRSGNRSGQAKAILNHHGFNNVVNGGTWQDIKQILNQ